MGDENAHTSSSRFDILPYNFRISLNNIIGLDMIEKLKLFALLRCSHFNFDEIFSTQSISKDSSQYFFEGITSAIYSCNSESVSQDRNIFILIFVIIIVIIIVRQKI